MSDDQMPYDAPTSDDFAEPSYAPDASALPDTMTTAYDLSGDGTFDIELTQYTDGSYYIIADTNFDTAADTLSIDTTGDGLVDTQVIRNDDGSYRLVQDQDGDGRFEVDQELTRDQMASVFPGAMDLLDSHFVAVDNGQTPWVDPTGPNHDPNSDPNVDPDAPLDPSTGPDSPTNWVEDGKLVGDPVGDAEHWFVQAQNGFCVPASVAQIVAEYTGENFADESQFVQTANELGLFVVGMDGVPGMTAQGALQLLEASGVPAELTVGSIDSIAQSLDEGRRIMLFVDSGEIWYGEDTEDNAADHAITVTGIDYERGVAIISDTGDPNGNMNEVPLDVFEDAWADSGYAMVQCDEPAPGSDQPAEPPAPGTAGASFGAERAEAETVVAGAVAAPSQLQSMSEWVTEHPWILLPVVLGAGALVARI